MDAEVIKILCNDEHALNAPISIVLTDGGIDIEDKLSHSDETSCHSRVE